MLYYIAVGILFFANAIQDIRKKTIHNGGLLFGAGVVGLLLLGDGFCSGVVADLLLSSGLPWMQLWGILPGVFLLVLSYLTQESIGRGDGYLLCISGAALGLRQNVAVLLYGVLIAGAAAVVLLVFRKVNRNTKLPFVPFLFVGFLLVLFQTYS